MTDNIEIKIDDTPPNKEEINEEKNKENKK
jgi:hypothetical protein